MIAQPARKHADLPRWALGPIATEALIDALPYAGDAAELRAEVLPLAVPGEETAAALLARVTRGDAAVYQRAFPLAAYCVRACLAGRNGLVEQDLMRALEDRAAYSGYALPPVKERALRPLLEGASMYGTPGWISTVFESDVWSSMAERFRAALPREAMMILEGDLCRCPETGRAFTHIERAEPVEAKSARDAVAADSGQVASAVVSGGGTWVGISHSHPQASATTKVVISETDLMTFRTNLRFAHATSLIVNISEAGDPQAVLLAWDSGSPVSAGFYVRARGGG